MGRWSADSVKLADAAKAMAGACSHCRLQKQDVMG